MPKCIVVLILSICVLCACQGSNGGSSHATAEDFILSVCIDPPLHSNREAIDLIALYVIDAWNGEPMPRLPHDLAVDQFDFPTILLHEAGHLAGIHDPEHLPTRTGVMYKGIAPRERRRTVTAADLALLAQQPDIFTLEYAGLGRDCAAPITFAPLDPGRLAEASHRWGGTITTEVDWYIPDI